MNCFKIKYILFIFLYILCVSALGEGPVMADIYMYVDSEGGIHFTNVPTSSDYVLYIRERPEPNYSGYDENKYDHIILEASRRYELPFSLLKAIIKVESGFNSKAVSKKGAVGLMQIMPENHGYLNIRDPYDPRENIMGGSFYLKRLLTRFKGKLPLALAAYNAGPSAVDKYQRVPPYKETKNYVKKVMTCYCALK